LFAGGKGLGERRGPGRMLGVKIKVIVTTRKCREVGGVMG